MSGRRWLQPQIGSDSIILGNSGARSIQKIAALQLSLTEVAKGLEDLVRKSEQ
jgi:hypothetical protein